MLMVGAGAFVVGFGVGLVFCTWLWSSRLRSVSVQVGENAELLRAAKVQMAETTTALQRLLTASRETNETTH